jgi:hypothetical protein
MVVGEPSEAASLFKLRYMTKEEREMNLSELLGRDSVLLLSPNRRNVLIVRFTGVADGVIEFKVSWGLFHKNVWEIFNGERDYIHLVISGANMLKMLDKTCFLRYVAHTKSGIAVREYFKWSLGVEELVFVFRRWLERLDAALLSFERMLSRLNICLGEHVGCHAGVLEYSGGIVYYRLFLDNSLSLQGEIMVQRDRVSVGIAFFEGIFDWVLRYQIRGLANPLEDYIKAMLISGDM